MWVKTDHYLRDRTRPDNARKRIFDVFAYAWFICSSAGSKAGSCFAATGRLVEKVHLAGLLGAHDVEDKRRHGLDSTQQTRYLASAPLLTFLREAQRLCSTATAPAASRLQQLDEESASDTPSRLCRHRYRCQLARPLAHRAGRSALLTRRQSHAKAVRSGQAMKA